MLKLFLFLLMAALQSLAHAQDRSLLLERAFLKDPAAGLSVAQVVAEPFRIWDGNLHLGFQPGVVWIRLKIDKTPEQGTVQSSSPVLRVGPHYLDQIEVFEYIQGQWRHHKRGALHPTAHCPDDMHCFALETHAAEPTTVYLRIQHRGFMALQIEVLSRNDLPYAVATRVRNITLSLVMAIGFLAMGLGFLLHDRTALMLVYCGFQASVVLFIASNVGALAKALPMLPSALMSDVNYFFYVLRVSMTVLLGWAALVAHQPGRIYRLGLQGLLVACGASTLLLLAGQMQQALKLSLLVFSINPFLQLYGVRVARDMPVSQRRVLTAGFAVYILALVMGLWLNFNDLPWLPSPGAIRQVVDWRLNGLAIGVVFFWITMLERSARNRAKAKELDALRDHAVLAQTRQAQLDERSTLIDMLTHELKNPLGTIRFALASLKRAVAAEGEGPRRIERIDASIRRMDDLIEHVAYTNKMERTAATDAPETLLAAPLIQELLGDHVEPQRWDVQVQQEAAFHCDRQLLVVILENLMTNAYKYSPKDQKVRIRVAMQSASPEGPSVAGEGLTCTCFEISNPVRPDAVPEETQLFERYYRHPSAQSQPGMGLGLSVVKTVAQKMGAQVSYRHEHGRVFFTLRVPF